MTAGDGADQQYAQLRLLDKAGDGGQGEVHVVAGQGRLLYKGYREPHKVDGAALAALVSYRLRLQEADRERLDREAAWPLCRVLDGSRVTGFLMNRAPNPMTWATSKGDSRLIDLSYLLREAKPAWSAVVQPAPQARRALAIALTEAIGRLHAAGLVLGDLSQSNVLWTLDPVPSVFLLDCDGIRLVGRAPVLPQADTPDWHDPLASPGTATVDSDRYKAALMIGRVLARDAYARPGKPLIPVTGVLDARREEAVRRLWDQAGGPAGGRPDLGQWRNALTARETIKLVAARPEPRPVVDRSKFDGRRSRGTISFRD
ncbi:hypothetical protein [Streptomyces sp. NPDC050145]|uniref:hypothetical protein n=1 Tax=Streptomyces sp. NPDC050145 TaxID=3365602 RepID=UPI0037A48EC9